MKYRFAIRQNQTEHLRHCGVKDHLLNIQCYVVQIIVTVVCARP